MKRSMWGTIRPPWCLKLGAREALLAESRRTWWMGRADRCLVRTLPDGAIQPSPVELNISDPASLADHLRALVRPHLSGGTGGLPLIPRLAVLVLPDLCVRAALIRLDHLPTKSDERSALIRWRLGQERLFPLTDAKVVYQILGASGGKTVGPQTVLAVAIREDVLRQYESLCESIGLIPVQVDTASFRLFNMWARSGGWSHGRATEDLVWISLLDGGMTVMIFQAGEPVFLRTKMLSSLSQPGEGNRLPAPNSQRLVEEIAASLRSCEDTYSQLNPQRAVVVCEEEEPALARLIGEDLGLEVEELGWTQAQRAGWKAGPDRNGLVGLPAVAGLLGGA